MARPRNQKKAGGSREAELEKRAASRGYRLEKDGKAWYAVIADTRYGPMASLDEVDEFLPKDQ
jgi:hypothetical protein